MKRDLDLVRQLLFDIASHGINCAVSTLRAAAVAEDADERVRYHLRLLIDAQLVKEIDRTAAGVPCVRLTNAGHELLELARSDARWHDARRVVAETSGGESLTVIRAVLTKWAIDGAPRYERRVYRRYRPTYHRIERPRRSYGYYADRYYSDRNWADPRAEREPLIDDERMEVLPTRPDYRSRLDFADWRERFDWRDAYERDVYYARQPDAAEVDRPLDEATLGVSLPVYMV